MIVEPRSDHVAWLDGQLVPWAEARMHVVDHHYGIGVFEGVRAYATDAGASVFRLADHTARLFRSAHIMRIGLADRFSRAALHEAQCAVIRQNRLGDAYLRPFVFYGGTLGLAPNTRDLTVHVAVLALEWRGGAPGRTLALRSSTLTRHQGNSLYTRAKANANYLNGILALQEAQAAGADEVLLVDALGFVTETSGANLFVVRDGALYTPPLECILEGITRDTLITLARARGLKVEERRMTRDDVYVADEAFITGTAAEVCPVRELDGRRIGDGARPVTDALRAAYADHVRGKGEHRPDWLTVVR